MNMIDKGNTSEAGADVRAGFQAARRMAYGLAAGAMGVRTGGHPEERPDGRP